VSEPEDGARELDDRVLEATSGPDQWYSPLSRVADGRQRALHAAVGAGRSDPQPGEAAEPALRLSGHRVGRDPLVTDLQLVECRVGERVRPVPRVEVSAAANMP